MSDHMRRTHAACHAPPCHAAGVDGQRLGEISRRKLLLSNCALGGREGSELGRRLPARGNSVGGEGRAQKPELRKNHPRDKKCGQAGRGWEGGRGTLKLPSRSIVQKLSLSFLVAL